MLANGRQGIFWLGKLRPHKGQGLTQSRSNQSLQSKPTKVPQHFFPLQSIAGKQQTGTKEEDEGQAGKRVVTGQAWHVRWPASDKSSRLSELGWASWCHLV